MDVRKCLYRELYSDNNPKKIFFQFYMNPSQIFFRNNIINFDSKRGLVAGWQDDIKEWKDEKYTVNTNLGTISFEPSFVFIRPKNDTDIKDSYLIKEQLIMNYELTPNLPYEEDYEEKLKEIVNDYLMILSFLEGQCLKWFYFNIFAVANDSYPVFEKKFIKNLL